MTERIFFTKDGSDLYGIEIRNGKSNGCGWSQHEVWCTEHCGEALAEFHIGDLYCGAPQMKPGYGFRLETVVEV